MIFAFSIASTAKDIHDSVSTTLQKRKQIERAWLLQKDVKFTDISSASELETPLQLC